MPKRTINEIYELIEQQRDSAANDYNREYARKYPSKEKLAILKGELMTYDGVLVLIKTSEVLDKEAPAND